VADVTYALAVFSLHQAISSKRPQEGERIYVSSYRDLRVWQNAMDLVVSVYEETQSFPKEERYGLTSQMRRASVSIPSNIAEGKGRSTDRDRARFFCHARGSLLELETQILIAQRLKYLTPSGAEGLVKAPTELGRMLNSLIQSIRVPENIKRSVA
jgi:four helix bundle protein